MTVALTHRSGLHASASRDADPDARVRAGTDGRIVVGWRQNEVTIGSLAYGWCATCAVCGLEMPWTYARYAALADLAQHHNESAP